MDAFLQLLNHQNLLHFLLMQKLQNQLYSVPDYNHLQIIHEFLMHIHPFSVLLQLNHQNLVHFLEFNCYIFELAFTWEYPPPNNPRVPVPPEEFVLF